MSFLPVLLIFPDQPEHCRMTGPGFFSGPFHFDFRIFLHPLFGDEGEMPAGKDFGFHRGKLHKGIFEKPAVMRLASVVAHNKHAAVRNCEFLPAESNSLCREIRLLQLPAIAENKAV